MARQRKYWTHEEDAIILANPDKHGSYLKNLLPGRSGDSINHRRERLGLAKKTPEKSPVKNLKRDPGRPLTNETAYFVRNDYATKIKRGYSHEEAIKWIVKAYTRERDIIEDILTNPKYDADIARCRRKVKYALKDKDRQTTLRRGLE